MSVLQRLMFPAGYVRVLRSLRRKATAYWTLNSGSWLDSVGSNNLAETNDVTLGTGIQGGAAQFTIAASTTLSIADNAALSMGDGEFTWIAWPNLDAKVGQQAIISKRNVAQENALYYEPAVPDEYSFILTDNVPTAVVVESNYSPTAGVWDFVAAWRDKIAQTINIQVNMGTINSTAFTGTVADSDGAFVLGGLAAGASSILGGRIDEVGIFKGVVLTQNELNVIYRSRVCRPLWR